MSLIEPSRESHPQAQLGKEGKRGVGVFLADLDLREDAPQTGSRTLLGGGSSSGLCGRRELGQLKETPGASSNLGWPLWGLLSVTSSSSAFGAWN